jgi:hypothetical protein
MEWLVDWVLLLVYFYFATIDSNAARNKEGGELGGFEEENKEHFADQDKPPLDASLLIFSLLLHC